MVSLKKVHVRRQRKLAEGLTNNHDHAGRPRELARTPAQPDVSYLRRGSLLLVMLRADGYLILVV